MIEAKYKELCETESDINKHLPIIRKYVSRSDIVVELGVRDCVSTWALLAGRPTNMVSVDVNVPPKENLKAVHNAAKEVGTFYKFIQCDSLNIKLFDIDVLFIDTVHLYGQLVKELWAHSPNVRKYLILHDTNIPEMRACVVDFLYNREWEIEEESYDHEGLMVLKRV